MANRWLPTEYIDQETGEILRSWQLKDKDYKRIKTINIKFNKNENTYRGQQIIIGNLRDKPKQLNLFGND